MNKNVKKRLHCENIVICQSNKIKKQVDEFLQLMKKFPTNYRRDPEDKRDFKFTSSVSQVLSEIENVPKIVDYSDKMSPVKNQGSLGSCVGFAVAAMKEWQEQEEHDKEVVDGKYDTRKDREYDLSESWIYWKAKEIDVWPEDEGTSIRYAMKVLNSVGVPTEKAWPYDDIDFGKPKRWVKMIARWALIDSYWRINNLDDLKIALLDGPVPIGVPCFYEFFYPGPDGYIELPADESKMYGGHCLCVCGYNDITKRIKFKNSWGTRWGEKGYGYLSYSYIRRYLWDAWACKDLSVKREMLKGK
ncbi:MAG: C1 family peptidase [Vallitaleaceae bacterium]|nr:C1 family peptidase [Vallitaleaceae bacterium]